MKNLGAALVLVLAAVGCGSEAGPRGPAGAQGAAGKAGAAGKVGERGEGAAVDGSRLRARYLKASDGAKAFLGWHDEQLGADCAFATASDGKTRCLPGTVYSAFPVNVLVVIYGDAACATPTAIGIASGVDLCPAPGERIVVPNKSACPVTQDVYEIGALMSPAPAMVYRLISDVCTSVPPNQLDVHHATISPPGSFVEATVD